LHLADLVPDVDVLVALEPAELGLHVLQVLAVSRPTGSTLLGGFLAHTLSAYDNSPLKEEATQAIREAWAWLEGQALLIPERHYGVRGEGRVLSRKGRRLGRDAKARRAFSGHRLAKEALHSSIREEVWALYQREKYETAVFEAMKAVEVAVRNAAALQAADIGAPLMRKAFDPNKGKLSNMTSVPAERQAVADLFAGAIGAYKNPHSHRNVALNDPDEAAEIILLANHLLRIVDSRR
jgi:uncharacterized protein (TIGR02391 family)